MTVALVHGNPETAAVWGPLLAELGRDDVVTLSLPASARRSRTGSAARSASTATGSSASSSAWTGPVDLVGHDWGGGHVVNVAMTRPDLLRSWTTDVIGVFDPGYVWHELAQVWQTPGDGERADRGRSSRRTVGGAGRPVLAAAGSPTDRSPTEFAAALGPGHGPRDPRRSTGRPRSR